MNVLQVSANQAEGGDYFFAKKDGDNVKAGTKYVVREKERIYSSPTFFNDVGEVLSVPNAADVVYRNTSDKEVSYVPISMHTVKPGDYFVSNEGKSYPKVLANKRYEIQGDYSSGSGFIVAECGTVVYIEGITNWYALKAVRGTVVANHD